MKAVVTGAAGFIGSHVSERLVTEGWQVVGLDCFTPYYAAADKLANLATLTLSDQFELLRADLGEADLSDVVDSADVIFHLAAQPGVRSSWSDGFQDYATNNVVATQRLLDAVRSSGSRPRVVFASSSSVYGEIDASPSHEGAALRPHSPYGVTKVAGELLVAAYVANFGLDAICLRLFSVYGPRQRPDMALHRMIEAALGKTSFPLYGDGSSVRDFTYVADVAEACLLTASTDLETGTVLNVAGGSMASIADLLETVGSILGEPVPVERRRAQVGEVASTCGATDRALAAVGWKPVTPLHDGVRAQVEWHRARRRPQG